MAKAKKSSIATSDTPESKSMIPEEKTTPKEINSAPTMEKQAEEAEDVTIIRILFHGSCPKLTPRGVGDLEYEIGINEGTDEGYLRITGNASSGAFSTDWIGINEIRDTLEKVQDQTFKAIVLSDLYLKRSSNNHGFLTAILKAEGVLTNLPQQLTIMRLESWEPLLKKIDSLKEMDISLPDHIAIAAKKRVEEKAQRMSETQAAKAQKTKGNSDTTSSNISDD